jgi:hypothetical protein
MVCTCIVCQLTHKSAILHTHFESLRVNADLTVWFIVEQRVPKYKRKVCVNVQSIFVTVFLNASLYVV